MVTRTPGQVSTQSVRRKPTNKRASTAAGVPYQEMFASSPDGILLIDPETQRVIEFNDAACRQLGYTREEFADLRIADFEAAETPEQAHARMQALLRDGRAEFGRAEFETKQRTKTGEIREMHVWAKTLDLAGRAVFYGIVRDITAQKQVERALRDSQRLHELSQRIARFGHWTVDLETNTVTWSDELYLIYGVPPRTPVSLDYLLSLVHPDDRSRLQAWNDRALSMKPSGPLEFRVVRPDGAVRVIEGDGEVQFSEEHRPIRMVGTARDVTERKQSELAQRRLLDLLDQTGRVARVGGWELDVETQVLHWTPEVYRIHEVDPASPPTVDRALEFYAPEARPVIAAAVQAAIDEGKAWDLELPLVTARGRRIWVRAQGTAEQRGGKTVRVYGAFQDITARRRADDTRRLQSAALNAAADAIVVTDCAGTIVWVNPAFRQLTGYALDEAVGRNPRDLIKSGKQTPAFFQEFWETILAGRTWRGQVINRRKDGSLYTEEQVVTPIRDGSGAITHFVAIKEDISDRLRLEAQFRQAQKMESVGQLTSGIAHDFNNLLTVINGMSELVLEQIGEDHPVHADVREIQTAGERAAGLTRQLLAFSRQQVMAPRVMDLKTVVEGMTGLLRRLLGEDVDLVLRSEPGLGRVKSDPGQIEQAIANLAVNARDAMPRGGQLTIETRNVTLGEADARQFLEPVPPGSYVLLAVTDVGVGMDDATRARIFEPFFTTKAPGRGTGLGLSTVFGIVKQSLGAISVQSEVGKGTRFNIYFPRVTEPLITGGSSPASAPGRGTETILVVEDNDGLRRLAARILTSAGYTVLEAANGEEALRLVEQGADPVHLLLSDVVMPGMDGRHLAEQLARVRRGIKVLYMSGHTSDTVLRHGIAEGQFAFLQKPLSAAALLRKVRDVLDAGA